MCRHAEISVDIDVLYVVGQFPYDIYNDVDQNIT